MVEKQPLSLHGPLLSRIVSGVWRWQSLSPARMIRVIESAVDAGITTFDHADIYGDYENEQRFGQALALQPALRHQIQIVTKCGIELLSGKRPANRVKHYNTTAAHLMASAENALKNLGVEALDVLLLHRPDPLMDAAEVAEAFALLKQQGKVKHVGVSNFSPAQFDLLQAHLPFPLVTNQIELSLFKPQAFANGTIDHLYRLGVAPMAWSPLGGGLVPPDEAVFFPLAAAYNATYSQLALAWLLRHPARVFPVIGSTQPERIAEAARAISLTLQRQDWFDLLQWATGREVA